MKGINLFLTLNNNTPLLTANNKLSAPLFNKLTEKNSYIQLILANTIRGENRMIDVTLDVDMLKKQLESVSKFDHLLIINGMKGSGIELDKVIKVVKFGKKGPKTAYAKDFSNRLFAAWDIETMANPQGVEVAFMARWVVSKGKEQLSGVIYDINILKTWDHSKLVKDFLEGMYQDCIKINGSAPKELFLYAHNSGNFDTHVVIKDLFYIHQEWRKVKPTIITNGDNDIYQLEIKYKDTRILMRDSMKIFPMSLKSLGKLMARSRDIGKLTINHDAWRNIITKYSNIEQALSRWNDETATIVHSLEWMMKKYETPIIFLEKYCLQDRVVVVEALKQFSNQLKGAGYALNVKDAITSSRISMKIWKKYFNSIENPVLQININTRMYKEFNKAYYGGRVEVFNSGINLDKVYHFDVPGLYAGIMQKSLPIGNPVYVSKYLGTDQEFIKLIKDLHDNQLCGIFKCVATCPNDLKFPVLPIKLNGKLTFPTGIITGTWFTAELLKAIEMGYELKPIDGWVFKIGYPLKTYSKTMTDLKEIAGQQKNIPLRTVAKLLTNRLYGKFARKYFLAQSEFINKKDLPLYKELFKVNSVTMLDADNMIVNHNLMPVINENNKHLNKDLVDSQFEHARKILADKDLNMPIAVAVTSYGRVQLYELIQEVLKRGGTMCYVDTDSIFARLPERPFDKPFGPYTWTGPEGEHTFDKALFLAPKMYYVHSLDGKLTFKVKGVNTTASELKYTYEELCSIFISARSVKYTNQTQYRHMPKSQGIGVIITRELEKSYKLQTNSKRIWQLEGTGKILKAYTTPINVNNPVERVKAITSLPKSNLDLITSTIKDQVKVAPFVTTNENVLPQGIKQNITDDITRVSIEVKLDDEMNNFNIALAHAIATAAHNTNKFDENKLNNLQHAQILLKSAEGNVWKTLAMFNKVRWLGYETEELKKHLERQLEALNMHYDNIYQWDTIIIKITFNAIPQLIKFSEGTVVSKLVQDIGQVHKAFEINQETKQIIKQLQDNLEQIDKTSEASKQILNAIKQKYEANIKDFTQKLAHEIYKYNIFKRISEDAIMMLMEELNLLKTNMKIDEIRGKMAALLVEGLILTLKKDFRINYHMWCDHMRKLLNLDASNENLVRFIHGLVFYAIKILLDSGDLKVYHKGWKKFAKGGQQFKITPHAYQLGDKWSMIAGVFAQITVLSQITFTPNLHMHDPDSKDIMLQSKDKVQQINTLNRVKVFLHPQYSQYIKEVLYPMINNKELFCKTLNLNTVDQYKSALLEVTNIYLTLTILERIQKQMKVNWFYHKHFIDRRGRVYPTLTQFRHMGPKWLRPLFCLSESQIIIQSFPANIKLLKLDPNHPIFKNEYWNLLASQFKLDLNEFENLGDFLLKLKSLETETLDPILKVRILEVEQLTKIGIVIMTSPFQVDIKNNAIQHASTIVNNVINMEATGVLPTSEIVDDLYKRIAKITLNTIKFHRHMFEFQELNNTFNDINIENTLKVLRAIAKRPTIVIIYSATKYSIIDYVSEALIENNIKLRNISRQLLANIIIDHSFKALEKEIRLMNCMKSMVNNINTNVLKWNFGQLSDFNPQEVYNKIVMKDLRLRIGQYSFKTTYHVVTNQIDKRAMKQAIFVNIIHSLDALHLQMIIKSLQNKNILTIHDAILVSHRYNMSELFNAASINFIKIHRNHEAFKSVYARLAERAGQCITYEQLLDIINIVQPVLNKTGLLMSL